MTTFTLLIKMGNAAMQSPEDVADALLTLAQQLSSVRADEDRIHDVNGNVVGWWSFANEPHRTQTHAAGEGPNPRTQACPRRQVRHPARNQPTEGPSMTAQLTISIEQVRVMDESPDLSWLEQDYNDEPSITPAEAASYREQDRKRVEAYNRGEWYCCAIMARATIRIPYGPHGYITQTITSPGIWGFESDDNEAHFTEVYRDECGELRDMLLALAAITPEAVDAAIESA